VALVVGIGIDLDIHGGLRCMAVFAIGGLVGREWTRRALFCFFMLFSASFWELGWASATDSEYCIP